MVVTKIKGKIVLVDSQLARVIGDNKVEVYKNENEIIIQFLDNGGGIPMDILNRVFEPYFTTKYKSQGKGISLYISQEIIKNLINGKIKVENESFSFGNEEYIGAKFIIIFNCY